jgi:signal transduction histidine kinase
MAHKLERGDLERLLEAGRSLVSAQEPERVLARVLDAARDLTGAQYAALGVLDRDKAELERFLFVGIDEELRERIGDLPRGHGILGELIRNPEPLRLRRIGEHPRSYGFPAEHPGMETFLGAPIAIRGEVFGNVYLTEKEGGDEFDERDEELIVVLAEWAAIAIDNARSHETSERRRQELERAVRGLRANASLALELGGEMDQARVLELVAKRGRALVEARSFLVLLGDEEGFEVVAEAGVARIAIERIAGNDLTADALKSGATRRLGTAPLTDLLGTAAGAAGLLAPLRWRGRSLGLLLAIDRFEAEDGFTLDDERALISFASSAASAIASTQAVDDERMRVTIASAERERRRWARELHDETLQDLGALRVMQESALVTQERDAAMRALAASNEQLLGLIDGLRGLITELRPAALDELGVEAAIEALIARISSRADLQVDARVDLGDALGGGEHRLDPELEATVYRIVQEGLTNVVKHAQAKRALVVVERGGHDVVVEVEDDGRGLESGGTEDGFGLLGMRERVQLARGELQVSAGDGGGTRIRARLPLDPSVAPKELRSESGAGTG